MTGTASEVCEFNDDTFKIDNYDLFSAWLFGKIKAECVIQSIDHSGCSLLLPASETVPSDEVKLVVMSPVDDNTVHSVFSVIPTMVDECSTSDKKIVWFQFTEYDYELKYEINLLRDYFKTSDYKDLQCSILNLQ